MLYQISKGSKSYGSSDIFKDINFFVKGNEKIAIVGRNGCGKSTLLKCICGIETLDSGEIHKSNNTKIGYLAQTTLSDENKTVKEEIEEVFLELFKLKEELNKVEELMKLDFSSDILDKYSKLQEKFEKLNGYDYHSEMMMILTKFGFKEDDIYRQIKTFSGGQRTRIAFCKLLLSKPDILLLDEPTNHLDLDTIEWLEGYLKHYPNAVVIVSHDRMFIDDIVDVVYEIEYDSMKRYSGNYTSFINQKKQDLERMKSLYARQQKEIERLESLIEKFRYKKSKASFAQSKIKYLDRMDKLENPKDFDTKTFKARFIPKVKGGKTVLTIEDLKVGYDNNVLCEISLKIMQGMKIAVIGKNGTGKSTLLKTLVGNINCISGSFLYGHQIETGYFDQQLAQFNTNKTVLEELWDENPELDRTTIRTILGQFLFSSDDVFKSVNVLSGGEKVRLSLAKLLLKQPNFLILDEPTNHLDIIGKEALEESLKDYEGTILFVSHDRYFIKQIANSLLIIENNKVTYYPNTYDEYTNNVKEEVKEVIVKKEKVYVKPINIKKEISKIEKEIDYLEKLLSEKRELRFKPEYYHDYRKMNELDNEIDDLVNKVENLMIKWEELSNH